MFKPLDFRQGKSFINKRLFFLLILKGVLFLPALSGAVQAAYVTDDFNIVLRSGPGTESQVVTFLKNGTKLDVLEEAEDWVRVSIADGKEGWIRKRHVSEETPNEIRIERLKKSLDETSIKLKVTSEKAAAIESENTKFKRELASAEDKLKKVETDYKRLQTDSANVVEIKNQYEETRTNLSKAMAKIDTLQAENNKLRSTSELRWFLAGAGIVTVAWIIGFIMGRINRGKRRQSPFIS